ncbi:CAP domain-containing protein [Ideonella azotifigens]|uniref:CAP domain-containing protein n=1 Tax=Ideonella azotifigens TaxID=513160 RepID=A0ABN1KK31_9BURK|nr:CAP domain-containing protein [Ideonella azotifigens]MCD2339293.1 CAP domain-containing protein [Ideonella azotifigens]
MAQPLLEEVNLLRTNPREYAKFVEERLRNMDAQGFYKSEGVSYASVEGRAAVAETIAFLRKAQPVKPLVLSNCLSNAAQGHVAEQGPEGATGHYSANGASPSDRATRHLSGTAYCGENISYGMPTPRDVVIQFVVDDGVPTRGHRENLFKDDYKSVGFGFGPHKKFGFMAVELMCMNAIR